MNKRAHEYLYPLVDLLLDKTVDELKTEGCEISCKKGCAHCCHLLVEASWEEAQELVYWLQQQQKPVRDRFIERIKDNAAEARTVFGSNKKTKQFMQPVDDGDLEIPEATFDTYFYDKSRPCPFLENNMCAAYTHRPAACRLHMVSSPADLCSPNSDSDADLETPDELETLKEDLEPVLVGVIDDGRWGQLGIMVEAVLNEQCIANEKPSEEKEVEAC